MKRRGRLSVSTSTTAHQGEGGAAIPEAAGGHTQQAPSLASGHHHRAASPSNISNLLQDLEHSSHDLHHHRYHHHQQQQHRPVSSLSPPPPLAPIRVRAHQPPPVLSPPSSASPEPSPRRATLHTVDEQAPSPEHGGTRRLLFMPKKHGKKASCAGRLEETGGGFQPLLKPLPPSQQPSLPATVAEEDQDSGVGVGGGGGGGGGAAIVSRSAPGSIAESRSISRASSSSSLGPPHAAGLTTSASPKMADGTMGAAPAWRESPSDDVIPSRHNHRRSEVGVSRGGNEGQGRRQGRTGSALADFALAEPTPRVQGEEGQLLLDPLMSMTGAAPLPREMTPVRYGAVIRLWCACGAPPEEGSGGGGGGGGGGFLGFAAQDARRIQGHLPQSGRFNVGMKDTFFVLPPYRQGLGWHVRETYFRVEDPGGKGGQASREGEPVRYGEELLLVDEEDHVMCHLRGRRYIRRKPKGTKGEMTVAFLPGGAVGGDASGGEVFYGDTGIRLRLQTRKGLRTEGVVLSALRREDVDAVGGFLNCLGRGRELVFDIEHAPPRIHDVSVMATLAHGGRVYVNRTVHHRVHWGQQLPFAAPSCQGHTAAAHEGCTICVTLSNGARLKMRQEHLGGLVDRVRFQQQGRGRETWLPTKGIPGEDVDLLVRLVPLDTVALDPHRLFLASSGPRPATAAQEAAAGGHDEREQPSPRWRGLLEAPLLLLAGIRELLPPGPVAVFLFASLALPPPTAQAAQGPLLGAGRTLLLLLASATAYLGVVHLLQGLLALLLWLLPARVSRALLPFFPMATTTGSGGSASSSSAANAASASELPQLPTSMLFDRWELAVLDWRVPPGAADGDALAGSYGHGAQPPPPPPVPPSFLAAEKGDADKAAARWARTLAWRREVGADGALARPHPRFGLMKRLYPQAFHFRDREGHVCFYELLGRLDVQGLLRAGVGVADLCEHIVLQQEFLWRVLQPRDEDRVLLVMDLKGVSFADVTGEVLGFAKAAVGLTSTHYPARSFRTLIVNTPSWFSVVFRILRPMLNEDTRRKIVFLEEVAVRDGAMLEYIAPECLPKEYGGACEVPLGESPFEKQLLEIVEAAAAAAAPPPQDARADDDGSSSADAPQSPLERSSEGSDERRRQDSSEGDEEHEEEGDEESEEGRRSSE